MVKWAVEFGQFDIRYRPCTSIKSQALANFVAKFSTEPIEELLQSSSWELYVDGFSTKHQSGARIVLISPNWHLFCEALPFNFKTSNNEAEYRVLIVGVKMAELRIAWLIVCSDSQLLVNQINKTYRAKEYRMNNYLLVVRQEFKNFQTIQVK